MQRSGTSDADNQCTGSSPAQSASVESVNEGGPRKRPNKRGSADTAVVKDLTNLATSASLALTQLTRRRGTETKHACGENQDDEDFMLVMLLYKILKEIPDGDEEDNLHIELQRLVNQTRRSVNQNINSVVYNRSSYTREQAYNSYVPPLQAPQAVQSPSQFVSLQPQSKASQSQFVSLQLQSQASLNLCTPYPVVQFPQYPRTQSGSYQNMANTPSYGPEASTVSLTACSFIRESGSNYTTL